MEIKRAYKYRIYPNTEQQEKLSRHFGTARFAYNYFLRRRIDHYAETGKTLTYHDTAIALTQLKKHPEYDWLKTGSDSQALQQSLRDLDTAYNNFFNKRTKFPCFKSKRSKQSCRYPQRFKLDGKKLYIPKIGWVRIVLHRPIEGKMKSLTVSRTKSGRYFASIQVEHEIDRPVYQGDQIGLDLGLKDFAVMSTGEKTPSPKYFRESEKKLRKLQRRLARTRPGSNGRKKARLKVARLQEKIANQRADFLHKLSRKLVDENQVIVIEDLHVKGMLRNHSLAKSISDSGWGEFVRQLQYKGDWYGCHIAQVDRFFPSSKRCSHCGYINESLTLKDRHWDCPECGTSLDRDVNAAQNLLNWHTVGATEINAGGQTVNPASAGTPGGNQKPKPRRLG